MAETNGTFSPAIALLHFDAISEQLNNIQAIAIAANGMICADGESENLTEAILFRHIEAIAANAHHLYALRDFLDTLQPSKVAEPA